MGLADRALAHERILGHALRAGVPRDSEEMRHFARELFLLCRQCGERGLADEARRLHLLALKASENRTLDLRTYGLVARMIGWSGAGKVARLADHLRP